MHAGRGSAAGFWCIAITALMTCRGGERSTVVCSAAGTPAGCAVLMTARGEVPNGFAPPLDVAHPLRYYGIHTYIHK